MIKKIIYAVALFFSSVIYTGCDALDLSPEDYFGSGNYWQNETHVARNLVALHNQLRNNYDMFYYLGELRGGTQRVGTSSLNTSLNYERLRNNALDASNPGTSNWHGLYSSSILNVNIYIDKVTNASYLTEAQKQAYLAPAHAMRALYYFMLYRTFGGVPIITEPKVINMKPEASAFYDTRATAQETMDFIKKEIGLSETYYGSAAVTTSGSAKVRWSKAATLMLKAEIYMWAAKVSISGFTATGTTDLQVAQTALNEIIGQYSLLSDFASIFSTANERNAEVILSLNFVEGEATNGGSRWLYQDALFISQKYGRNGALITNDTLNLKGTGGVFRDEYKYAFWATYDADDTRRDATFLEYYGDAAMTTSTFGCFMKKYVGSVNANGSHIYDSDVIVYRYADALLMMAEVVNGLGGDPSSYINQVRARAYGNNTHNYTNGTFAQNELTILQERDKEFVGEGKRWFDVVRLQGGASLNASTTSSLAFSATANYPTTSAILNTSDAHMLLWPIDTNTLANNPNLTQTPGY